MMPHYNDNFIDVKLTPKTVYFYTVRRAIQKAIDQHLDLFWGSLMDLGCGEMPYRQYLIDKNKKITKYIGVDLDSSQYHSLIRPDIVWDGKTINVKDSEFNTAIAIELFEHLPNIEATLREIRRILSGDGVLFFTVPFVWPLHETPSDEYRYTPYSLKRNLVEAGFRDVAIAPLGGWNAALAQMLGIWIYNYRKSINSQLKRILFNKIETSILYFIIRRSLGKDSKANSCNYGENTMPIGFYGCAWK